MATHHQQPVQPVQPVQNAQPAQPTQVQSAQSTTNSAPGASDVVVSDSLDESVCCRGMSMPLRVNIEVHYTSDLPHGPYFEEIGTRSGRGRVFLPQQGTITGNDLVKILWKWMNDETQRRMSNATYVQTMTGMHAPVLHHNPQFTLSHRGGFLPPNSSLKPTVQEGDSIQYMGQFHMSTKNCCGCRVGLCAIQ